MIHTRYKTMITCTLVCLSSTIIFAQRTVAIRNLWTTPQVHVIFGGYKVSFAIRDINKALRLLSQTGDTTYGAISGLDTAKNYTCELYPGGHTQYRSYIQPMLQNGIGVYLLSSGHALVENSRHKALKNIVVDYDNTDPGIPYTVVRFYDPATHEMLFYGAIDVDLIGKDMGIDD